MGVCDGCGRIILVIINILFSLIGLALFIASCIVRWGTDIVDKYLQDAYNAFVKALEESGASTDISELNISDLLGDATIAFIVIGLFFFLLGIIGCVGACCKVRCLLIVYAVILITIFVAEVVFVILLFTISSKIDSWLQTPILDKIKEDYTGTNGTDAFTLAINFVMHRFECCGIKNATDFTEAKKWPGRAENYSVPLICCKNISDTACAEQPTSTNSYVDQGCYKAITDWINDHKDILIGIGAGVAAVQLLLIIFSIVICCRNRKDDDIDSYSEEIPIQPYRNSKDLYGERNEYFQASPKSRREPSAPNGYGSSTIEHRGGTGDQGKGYTLYRGRGGGTEPGFSESYAGRTDYYTGPPNGYDSRR